MSNNFEKLKSKVAKLLRQAEDVAGTPEEAVFQAKAFELMAKYGIDQASVEATKQGLDTSDLRDAIQWIVPVKGKYAQAQLLLLHNLAQALHSKTVYSSRGGELVMFVYGVPTHIERIKALWSILQPQMMRLVEKVRPDYDHSSLKRQYDYTTHTYVYRKTSGAGHLKSYRRSWIAGFAQAVGDRLRAEENKALESAEAGGALVLFKADAERAELALRGAHPRLGRAKRTTINASGYAHGQRDGRNAAFSHALAR